MRNTGSEDPRFLRRTSIADKNVSTCRGSNDDQQNEAQDIKQASLGPAIAYGQGGKTANNMGSHHALTLAIDDKLYLAPLDKAKVKVSHHRLPWSERTPGANIPRRVECP
jgi:hypothetical protein